MVIGSCVVNPTRLVLGSIVIERERALTVTVPFRPHASLRKGDLGAGSSEPVLGTRASIPENRTVTMANKGDASLSDSDRIADLQASVKRIEVTKKISVARAGRGLPSAPR